MSLTTCSSRHTTAVFCKVQLPHITLPGPIEPCTCLLGICLTLWHAVLGIFCYWIIKRLCSHSQSSQTLLLHQINLPHRLASLLNKKSISQQFMISSYTAASPSSLLLYLRLPWSYMTMLSSQALSSLYRRRLSPHWTQCASLIILVLQQSSLAHQTTHVPCRSWWTPLILVIH